MSILEKRLFMKGFLQTLLLLLATACLSCHFQSQGLSKMPGAHDIIEEPKNDLFVFVGEKIEVRQLPPEKGDVDLAYKARYKVLQKVFGHYKKDVIEFIAYDHYGTPAFSNYHHVLLFVAVYNKKYYHEKYIYNDVYLTKDGRWAGPYAARDYAHDYNQGTPIKPVKIAFANEVSYPITAQDSQGNTVSFMYPDPYYKIIGNKAIAVYGNYVEELFQLKRDGYLTARGFFGERQKRNEIEIVDVDTILHPTQIDTTILQ